MSDGGPVEQSAYTRKRLERRLANLGALSEILMEILEVLTAFIMVGLFTIGVYDLGLKLITIVTSGTYTDPDKVIKIIDTALLLMIIVEIYRTVIAYIEDLNILPVVLNVAIIAMARKIISFRTGKYASNESALIAAIAYGFLLAVVIAAFFLIHRAQEQASFDIFAADEGIENEGPD